MKTIEVYEQSGTFFTTDHKQIGYSPDMIKGIVDLLSSPNFAYTRAKNYGIAIIHKDPKSPTGVLNVGGLPYELEFLIAKSQKYGSPLSPTEDLRTAR